MRPGFTLRAFVLNTSSPLFRNNLPLRQAVNLAIDRKAFGAGNLGARLTDQVLPPSLPGYHDAKIYPLRGPEPRQGPAARARPPARREGGPLRHRPAADSRHRADAEAAALGRSGSMSRSAAIPSSALATRLSTPGEPFDMTFLVTPNVDYYDPYAFLNLFFESRFIGRTNWSNLRSPKYDRLLRAASRLRGQARLRAYGRLDVQLARDVAPIAATGVHQRSRRSSRSASAASCCARRSTSPRPA